MKLFMVYLGGLAKGAQTEVHDTVFVVGKSIKDCYPQIKAKWFGKAQGLHIDSWAEITQIPGYLIEVNQSPDQNLEKLFFVNLGFSTPQSFGEQHSVFIITAETKAAAKIKAKTLFPKNTTGHHVDNLTEISIEGYNIHLTPDENATNFKFENVYWKLS